MRKANLTTDLQAAKWRLYCIERGYGLGQGDFASTNRKIEKIQQALQEIERALTIAAGTAKRLKRPCTGPDCRRRPGFPYQRIAMNELEIEEGAVEVRAFGITPRPGVELPKKRARRLKLATKGASLAELQADLKQIEKELADDEQS